MSFEPTTMRKTLFGCALIFGLGSFPATGFTQVDLRIGRDGLEIQRECNPRYEDCYRGRNNYEEDRPRCTEGRALGKASRMGVRGARIADAGRRSIEVSGRDRYGERIRVTFGRAGNCPVLR